MSDISECDFSFSRFMEIYGSLNSIRCPDGHVLSNNPRDNEDGIELENGVELDGADVQVSVQCLRSMESL